MKTIISIIITLLLTINVYSQQYDEINYSEFHNYREYQSKTMYESSYKFWTMSDEFSYLKLSLICRVYENKDDNKFYMVINTGEFHTDIIYDNDRTSSVENLYLKIGDSIYHYEDLSILKSRIGIPLTKTMLNEIKTTNRIVVRVDFYEAVWNEWVIQNYNEEYNLFIDRFDTLTIADLNDIEKEKQIKLNIKKKEKDRAVTFVALGAFFSIITISVIRTLH